MRGIRTIFALAVCLLMVGCSKESRNKGGPELEEDTKDNNINIEETTDQEETNDQDTRINIKDTIQNMAESTGENEMAEGTFIATEDYVKQIGRTYLWEDILWLSFSGTGIEFTYNSNLCELTLIGDSTTSKMYGRGKEARVAIYHNDTLVVDTLMDEKLKTFTLHQGEVMEGKVRVVKLSETADSSVGIKEIKTDGSVIKPTADQDLKIEFIGDSITCGYGVDEGLDATYSTANEDTTKAYAYKTAMKLNADYSFVSMSGHGIISGYTGSGEINTEALIPPYYDKLGKSYGKFSMEVSVDEVQWDFTKFIPDIVVINLGTNDFSYCKNDVEKSEEYAKAYVEFLKTVREKNQGAHIICTLGIMGGGLYPYIEKAVERYQEETQDVHISSFQFAEQLASDGYAVDWHPSEITHEKAANQLVTYIDELGLKK